MESPLSMDEVLRKRYHGKLEHRETDLVKTLLPPCWVDQFALTAATPVPPVVEDSFVSSRESPLAPQPISTVLLPLLVVLVTQIWSKPTNMALSPTLTR